MLTQCEVSDATQYARGVSDLIKVNVAHPVARNVSQMVDADHTGRYLGAPHPELVGAGNG